jgi:hypothetical protein
MGSSHPPRWLSAPRAMALTGAHRILARTKPERGREVGRRSPIHESDLAFARGRGDRALIGSTRFERIAAPRGQMDKTERGCGALQYVGLQRPEVKLR